MAEKVADRFTIERQSGPGAAVDGEPVDLGPRIELSIERRALRILVP